MVTKGTTVIGMRVEDEVREELLTLIEKKGGKHTLSSFTGSIVKQYLRHANKADSEGLTLQNGETYAQPQRVNPTPIHTTGQPSNMTIPVYDPLIHKAGDHVLVRKGIHLVPMTVPDLDMDGRLIPG